MKRKDFNFDLPPDLIAQQPLAMRSDSRLLHLQRPDGNLADRHFRNLPDLLNPGDLLVFNDTRVIPARLFGKKTTGGKVEILIERLEGERDCVAQLRASKSPKEGSTIELEDGSLLRVQGRSDSFFLLHSEQSDFSVLMERLGHMPLPPYIGRADNELDLERYQTIYASRPGAVAAPTAGLHFDQPLLDRLERQGVQRVNLTLHVGAGTFQPVRVENIEDHEMHAEYLNVSDEVCRAVSETRARGSRVIAVGTTAVRSLETAAQNAAPAQIAPFSGQSRIFIYPGYEFLATDGMITNFHLPESTLLMLVSAFAGTESIRSAYRHAIKQRYRFFSYGDAMLLL